MSKKNKKLSKKDKKLSKLIKKSDSEDDSEHELSYYLNDRVKMMKEVLKIIKPKRIRTMAPNCMKNLDNEEINSMLLEELLGISNKRLKAIFNGQELNEDSSSTEDEEDKPVDVISLDDVTDDDFVIDLDSDKESKSKREHHHHHHRIKKETTKKIKKEKKIETIKKTDEDNLMSVLELLELQARARAIRSQLALESSKKANEKLTDIEKRDSDNDEDAIIIESPKETEIIISSSESEDENSNSNDKKSDENGGKSLNSIKKVSEEEQDKNRLEESCEKKIEGDSSNSIKSIEESIQTVGEKITENKENEECNNEKDETVTNEEKDKKNVKVIEENKDSKNDIEIMEGIILNVDQSEMDCIHLD